MAAFFEKNKKQFLFLFFVSGVLLLGLGLALKAEKEIQEMASNRGELLKVGFSTDWEYGSRKRLNHKLTSQAPELLKEVVRHFNEDFQPDIVVGGGDYVESSNVRPATALAQLEEVVEIFRGVQAPIIYALGNHDLRVLTKEEVKGILGIEEAHSYRDIGAWRIVVFDTNFLSEDDSDRGRKNYVAGYVSKAELEWLDKALQTNRPTAVFSHHSLFPTLDADGTRRTANVTNGVAVRQVLESHKNVIASFSGHTPRPQYVEHNGIYYFVADTLVHESGLGAFADIELWYNPFSSKAEVVFHHYGLHRETYSATAWLREDARENNWQMFRGYLGF